MIIEQKGLFKKHFIIKDFYPNSKRPELDLLKIRSDKDRMILSIDGGGIKGILPVYQLYLQEYYCNVDLYKTFDSFYGCSTGSIISSLLAMGFKAKDILKLYIEKGNLIFKENPFKGLLWHIYSKKNFKKILNEYIGSITFEELFLKTGKELNILVVDCLKRKTITCNYKKTPTMKIATAVLASCSGPIYFGPVLDGNNVFYDGGTGHFTTPVLKAFNQEYYVRKTPIDKFFIYTLGCGYQKIIENQKDFKNGNKIKEALWTFNFMREESVTEQIDQLEYRRKDLGLNFERWDIELSKDLNTMDKTNNIKKLVEEVDHK